VPDRRADVIPVLLSPGHVLRDHEVVRLGDDVGPEPQDELLRRFCYYSGLTPEQALAEGGLA